MEASKSAMQINGFRAGEIILLRPFERVATEEQDRTDPSSLLPMPKTVVTKPYDWTYTSTYPGHDLENESPAIRWRVADPEDASHEIPIAELTRQDPILFYAEIPLYEDELHDNGSSALLVRIVC